METMKKILLYTDTPQIGGAEIQMLLLAKSLDKSKFTPILACGKNKTLDNWCDKWKKEDLQVIRLNFKHKHNFRQYFQLKKIIKKEKIDLLHAHVWNPASCRYALMLKKIPIITTEHDPFKLNFIKDFFKKRTLKNIKKIVTVSKNNKKILETLYPDHKKKMMVIHNGIDTDWWKSQLLRLAEEDWTGIKKHLFHAKKDTLIITSIGELHERKGHKYLIEAMLEITQEFPNVKLVLIGEGKEKENLEKLIKKLDLKRNVVLAGRQKDIPKLLKSSDIFCLPSKREAFGLVNAEAMMAELPVVASEAGGIPEIVKTDETGIIVPPKNSKEIAKAIIKLIKNPETRKKMGHAGKERVLKKFDTKLMAKEYENLYEESF